ncbi:MAG TPA: prenyltransferase [Aggregatilinea sp.]|uniref:prenyltransferase n=1 Tax=Aggregatilinea sp. TaxID=2806333 RepID=UPI002D00832D|nr:prenyltransferase [Aggregatilinea sp.]HML23167.1 prenyltransferase [Aggregatilinea sp.]
MAAEVHSSTAIKDWPLVKRWTTAVNTCNCPDVHHADTFTRWLVIARACVFSMTFMSGLIGVLLAVLQGGFDDRPLFRLWLGALSVIGLVAAHATNNLVNDWTDVRKGVDTEDYPRSQYSTHPVLGGLTTPNRLLAVALGLTLFDALIMLYLAWVSGPAVIAFAVSGLVLSLGYTIFLKRYALGEITALAVWGPLMTGGTVYAISDEITRDTLLLTLPYGLIVASVLIGKHTDKIEYDRPVGVHSIPVLLGRDASLALNKVAFVGFYVLIAALVLAGVAGAWVLLTVLALPRLVTAWKVYSQPKPTKRPDDWPVWPLWYVGWAMFFNRRAGELFILGLILNLVVPEIAGALG